MIYLYQMLEALPDFQERSEITKWLSDCLNRAKESLNGTEAVIGGGKGALVITGKDMNSGRPFSAAISFSRYQDLRRRGEVTISYSGFMQESGERYRIIVFNEHKDDLIGEFNRMSIHGPGEGISFALITDEYLREFSIDPSGKLTMTIEPKFLNT